MHSEIIKYLLLKKFFEWNKFKNKIKDSIFPFLAENLMIDFWDKKKIKVNCVICSQWLLVINEFSIEQYIINYDVCLIWYLLLSQKQYQ